MFTGFISFGTTGFDAYSISMIVAIFHKTEFFVIIKKNKTWLYKYLASFHYVLGKRIYLSFNSTKKGIYL